MKTLFSVFYYSIITHGDKDSAIATFKAAIFLALVQTSNLFTLICLAKIFNIVRFEGQINIGMLGITGGVLIVMNLFLFKEKQKSSKKEKILSWVYSIISLIIFAVLLGEYDILSTF